MWALILELWDHDLSQKQILNQLKPTEPPRSPYNYTFNIVHIGMAHADIRYVVVYSH